MGFFEFASWVAAHPRRVLALWLCAIALGVSGELRLPQVALGGSAGISGSASKAVDDALRTQFSNPFIDPLVVAVHSARLRVDEADYFALLQRVAAVLTALPEIRRVSAYSDARDARLRSADGHTSMLLLGPAASDINAQRQAVIAVRAALAPLRAQLQRQDPQARIAVTGGPAVTFDLNDWSARGGDRAEKRALPLTLAILVLAFGTLLAACLPFVTGLATTSVALGLAFVLAHLMPVSNLLGNVVTMVGLAVGIDYSLLMVTHYRERAPQADIASAVAATVAEAGQTICWSGLTVMIGLLGLLFSPILETRSVGIGGALVVCISVLAAVSLLPAILVLVGPAIERWRIIPQRAHHASPGALWRRLGEWIVRHPLRVLLVSGAGVLALAAPLLAAHSGFSNEPWFLASGMESRLGAQLLSAERGQNASLPIYAIVRSTDGQPLLAAAHLPALLDYADRIARDRRVAAVDSPVTLQPGLGLAQYTALYRDLGRTLSEQPSIAERYLSRDRSAALFQITAADGLTIKQIQQLALDLAVLAPGAALSATLGGTPVYDNDFNRTMARSLPWVFGFVIAATLLLLFTAFRSYLLPVKAVLMNLLAVAAGYGVVVAIFHLGWLNGLVGLERPFAAIPLEVPLMVFCLSFGLSMDYELFLLFRIQQEYTRTHDNERAVVNGLAAVAPVITSAGLIMAVVFGAFIAADLPVLKMIGVGLCVSVLVDATLIRAFVVPAAMVIAGRWNWYPGRSDRS